MFQNQEVKPSFLNIDKDLKIEVGAPVWVWSQNTRKWEEGNIVNTDLLEDRCLFEVRASNNLGSTFDGGYGITCHQNFQGVDWHFCTSESMPKPHPLAQYPNLQYDNWVLISEKKYGQITRINSKTEKFDVEHAADWNDYSSRISNPEYRFDFKDITRFKTFTSDTLDNSNFSNLDIVVLPENNSLGKAAYKIKALDLESKILLLETASMLTSQKYRTLSFSQLSGYLKSLSRLDGSSAAKPWKNPNTKIEFHPAQLLEDILNRFPIIDNAIKDKRLELSVVFSHRGRTLTGKTAFYDGAKTLPAFLEVLIKKTEEELDADISRNKSAQVDMYHRFQVRPNKMIKIE